MSISKGDEYEIFVKNLQQAIIDSKKITGQKNIKVENKKKIKNNLGKERVFDLYWEFEYGGIKYKTVIECKNYKRKIEVSHLESFITRIRDTPGLTPVFATKTGYQKGAIDIAKHHNIDLLIVREQRDDDWVTIDGIPRINIINLNIKYLPAARIINFNPVIDANWMIKNTEFNPETLPNLKGLNINIFIEDNAKNKKYSLYDLANQLQEKSASVPGKYTYNESFDHAYLRYKEIKLKLIRFEVEYICFDPIEIQLNHDYANELIGVIEYLDKKSTSAIFKDGVVESWK